MSRHNYTNPAFCQNSELYQSPSQRKQQLQQQQQLHLQHHQNRVLAASSLSINSNSSAFRIQRSESSRSFSYKRDGPIPPRPGSTKPSIAGSRYALVPVEELADSDRNRYAILPTNVTSERNLYKEDDYDEFHRSEDTFTSLPPNLNIQEPPKMKPAFSSDFGNSFVMMVDNKSNKRYAVVPQADDEDYVDDNQEIIQMHNGKAHRYAIIPAEEEETCLSNTDLNKPLRTSTPQKHPGTQPGTPVRNEAATKRLHEILSTPVKTPIKRAQSIPRNINSTPKRYQSQQLYASNCAAASVSIHRKQELLPQRLQYERPPPPLPPHNSEKRTTAVISPRLANTSMDPESNMSSVNKNSSYPQKIANAAITLGVVSFILTVGSFLNSGLCLYMIAHVSFYRIFVLISFIRL